MVVFINTDIFNVTRIRLRLTTRFPIPVLKYDKILNDLQVFIRFDPPTMKVIGNTCILKHFKNTCKLP